MNRDVLVASPTVARTPIEKPAQINTRQRIESQSDALDDK
jgi:hypothetical protein